MLQKVSALSWPDRWLLVEAVANLAVARLQISIVPFNRLAPGLSRTGFGGRPDASRLAEQVGWSVRAAAGRTPWPSTCLVQAVAAKRMLQRRTIPSSLYLGVAKNAEEGLDGHAWLCYDQAFLTGKHGHERYTITAVFADT